MFRDRKWLFVGIVLIVVGAAFLLNSFSITGFAVLENFDRTIGGLLGIAFVMGGIALFMARAHHHRFYGEIGARLYESLGNRNAYGHKTEQISITESRIAVHGLFRKDDVRNVIEGEIEAGRLLRDKSGYAISITTRPEKIEEIEKLFGKKIKRDVMDRFHDLEERKMPASVR